MKPLATFNLNLTRVRAILRLYLSQPGPRNKDLLRASILFTMGALDAYIHQIVSENMVKFIKLNLKRGKKNPNNLVKLTKIVDMFKKTFDPIDYLVIFENDRPYVQLRKKFDQELFLRTYESTDQIQKAFALFAINNFWDEFKRSGTNRQKNTVLEKIPKQLDALFDRRNQIVHEMDRNRSRRKKGKRRSISVTTCRECIRVSRTIVKFIESSYLDKDGPSYLFH